MRQLIETLICGLNVLERISAENRADCLRVRLRIEDQVRFRLRLPVFALEGLVQEVVEPGQQLTRATELAQVVSAQAPLGVRATLKSARLAMTEGEEAAIRQFLPDLQAIMQSEDMKEGIQSFIERRQAHFKGR